MAESLSINGTALSSLLYAISGTPGLVGAPPMRGSDLEVPGRDGAIEGRLWYGPRVVTVQGVIFGNSTSQLVPADARARYLDKIRALSALVVNNGKPFTLSRVIPRETGGDLTVETTARYLSGLDSIEQAAAHAGRVAFSLLCLDPVWYPSSDTTLSAITGSSSPSILGDVATKRITLTFSGVTATQRLTNNTTGEWVEVAGQSAAATALDVRNLTATRSSTDVSGSVNHSSTNEGWFSLVAGTNSLTLTGGGQVVVAYRGAFL